MRCCLLGQEGAAGGGELAGLQSQGGLVGMCLQQLVPKDTFLIPHPARPPPACLLPNLLTLLPCPSPSPCSPVPTPPCPPVQMSMADARARELAFFHKKADYGGIKNIGTGFLSTELSERLVASVRRQLPNISAFVNKSVMDLQRELEAMGGPAATSRGEMIHLVLTLCRKFETSFAKLIDGGKGGAWCGEERSWRETGRHRKGLWPLGVVLQSLALYSLGVVCG